MVRVVRGIANEEIAEKLGVSPGEVTLMLSDSAQPTLEQLRQLFLAVGMDIEGIFESYPGHPGRTALAAAGFGNAIEQGLQILDLEAPEEEIERKAAASE